jgi:hypothetical protein
MLEQLPHLEPAGIYAEWLSAGRTHAGIILCADDHLPVGEQVRRLAAIGSERVRPV